jgi:hypothetical protein
LRGLGHAGHLIRVRCERTGFGDSAWPLSDAQPRDVRNSSDHRGAAAFGVRRAATGYGSRNDQDQTRRKASEVVLVASAHAGTRWYNATWTRPPAMADGEFRPMVGPASSVDVPNGLAHLIPWRPSRGLMGTRFNAIPCVRLVQRLNKMRESRSYCGCVLRGPRRPRVRFVKGQPNGVRPSTSAPYHRHHVGKRARNQGGAVPGDRQGIRRHPHSTAPTRSERPQEQTGRRRIPRPSLRSRQATLYGVHVLSCAS